MIPAFTPHADTGQYHYPLEREADNPFQEAEVLFKAKTVETTLLGTRISKSYDLFLGYHAGACRDVSVLAQEGERSFTGLEWCARLTGCQHHQVFTNLGMVGNPGVGGEALPPPCLVGRRGLSVGKLGW
jgi:hypothetical protein